MKTLLTYKNLTLFIALILAGQLSFAQKQTAQSAQKWVESGIWKKGLTLNLHPSTNNIEFAKQYNSTKAVWDKVFEFIRDHNLELLAPGKYPIDGNNAYATITDSKSKELEKTAWESHRNYIDLQYIIKGQEKIGVAPVDSATVTEPYNAAKDVAHYNAEGKYYIGTPDIFFLFFPGDAHRPSIKVDGYDTVKKLVIKIKVTN
jgi:YhcH/YjgK/YiaL family protein